ncbi:MAG: RDD family protein [Spiroplasma sp.]
MNKDFETYHLAKTWKRIIARLIDIIIISIIPGTITLIWFSIDKNTINNWQALLIIIIINYILFSLYFVVAPWKFNGQTLGKKIFLIKLVNESNKKIPFKIILLRETFLIFIPITLSIIAILLANIFLHTNIKNIDDKTISGFWISVLTRTIHSFIASWYLGIIITTKIDKKHQLFYDRKFKLYVIDKNPLPKKLNPQETKTNLTSKINHIHLGTKQPGNISQKNLDEINDL